LLLRKNSNYNLALKNLVTGINKNSINEFNLNYFARAAQPRISTQNLRRAKRSNSSLTMGKGTTVLEAPF
jgi:hypothetical protein